MEAWRARLAAAQTSLLEDDEEEELKFLQVVRLGMANARCPQVRSIVGGSRPGRSPNIERYRHEMHLRMMSDYFSDTPVYGPDLFRRRYRMRRSLFMTILDRVCAVDAYFVQKPDAVGRLGLSPHQKITSALRMLCYGLCADATDEYCRTSESTAMECMKRFCLAIRAEFEEHYLRQPTRADFDKQLAINSARGFPGMFASLNCMHYEWKNCPVAWQGDFGDRDGKKSIILEAVVDESLHIWHVFFGLPGSNNDLNVLDRSPLIHNMLTSEARDMHFVVNGCDYDRYYLLTDGIYPEWSCFIQSIHLPQDEKRIHFAKRQEAVRKDVERCFGVLQARFAILRNPCRQWTMEVISNIMFACCIMHNMIIEDEENVEGLEDIITNLHANAVPLKRGLCFSELMASTKEIENKDTHYGLRGDLIEHLWVLKGAHMA
jgi:hypothetical protein